MKFSRRFKFEFNKKERKKERTLTDYRFSPFLTFMWYKKQVRLKSCARRHDGWRHRKSCLFCAGHQGSCMLDPSQRGVFVLRIMRSIWIVFLDSWQVLTFEARHIWQRGLSLLLENACGNILNKSHLTDRVSAQTIYQLILLKRLCGIV